MKTRIQVSCWFRHPETNLAAHTGSETSLVSEGNEALLEHEQQNVHIKKLMF